MTYTLMTRQTALGNILVSASGMSVYTYTKDTPNSNTSACTGACLANWPAVTVAQGTQPTLSPNITGTLGTFTRSDTNATQVTYDGWPVYFFHADAKPGDTKGQGLFNSWFVIVVTPTTSSSSSTGYN